MPKELLFVFFPFENSSVQNSSQLLSFLSKNIPEYLISERCPILRKALVDVVSKAFPSGIFLFSCYTNGLRKKWWWYRTAWTLFGSGAYYISAYTRYRIFIFYTFSLVQINDDLLFHENEYVSTAALKCLLARRSTVDPFSDCVKVIEKGIHSSTK